MNPNIAPTERPRYGKGLALLSLDGGGIRGLSSLYILQRLMEQLDPENPPRPCECFDLIGGTSTGGLIALMLGRLRMTVVECIDAYRELMPAIFEKSKHRYSISKGKLQGRYDGKAIEEGVKRILKERNIRPDAPLKDAGSTCKTFVCVTRKTGLQTTLFSNYPIQRRSRDLYNAVKIWEAARATSAATTFFEPIKILHEEFVDGAFGANNPIDEVWTEAGDIWTRNTGETLEDNISCFVSIGTGIPAFGKVDESLVGMVQTLKAIATNCESAAERFQRHHPALDGRFFRFNVPRGLETIGLEEISKTGDLIAATRQYLESQSAFLEIEKFQSAFQQRQRIQRICQYVTGMAGRALQSVRHRSKGVSQTAISGIDWITNTSIFDEWLPRHDGRVLYVDWEGTEFERNILDDHVVAMADSLLQLSPHPAVVHLTTLDLPYYSRVFAEPRRCEDDLCDHHRWADPPNPHYVFVDVQRPMTPKEIMVAFACVQIVHNASPAELAIRISKMSNSHRSLLEILSSEESVEQGSRVDYERLLEEYSAPLVCSLVVHTLQGLPSNTLTLFSIRHPTDSAFRSDDVEAMLGICCESLGNTSTRLHAAMHIYGSRSSETSLLSSLPISRKTEYLECLASLKAREVLTRQNQILPPAPGTFHWLDDHPSFRSWQNGGGTLWIRGKPGSGKSTLAKDILMRIRSQDRLMVVGAWFYSIKLDFAQRSHQSLLRALLGNFLEQDEALFQKHVQIYRKARLPPYDSSIWSRNLLEEFLRGISLTQRDSTIMAVIDALDESENDDQTEKSRRHLAMFLLDLAEHPESCMRFIILSRPYESLQFMFRDCEQIVLEQENGQDLEEVIDRDLNWLRCAINESHDFEAKGIESQKPDSRRRRRRPRDAVPTTTTIQPDLAFASLVDTQFQAMRNYLIQNAKGVFLWVTLVLKELHQISKNAFSEITDLDRALRSLPSELEDLYATIAGRLRVRDFKKTRRILDWIIGTSESRALTLSMLFEAISIDEGIDVEASTTPATDPFLVHKSILRQQSWGAFAFDVYDRCGGLVDVVPPDEVRKRFQEYHEEEINDQWVVVLLHRTSLDFIASIKCPEGLRTNGSLARSVIERGLVAYIQVYLPTLEQNPTFHPRLTIRGNTAHNEAVMTPFSSLCAPLYFKHQEATTTESYKLFLDDILEDPMERLDSFAIEPIGELYRGIGAHLADAGEFPEPAPKAKATTTDSFDEPHSYLQADLAQPSNSSSDIDSNNSNSDQGTGIRITEQASRKFREQPRAELSETRRSVFSTTTPATRYLDELFSIPHEPVLQYLEERRLLRFALDMLPRLWGMDPFKEKLLPYKLLATKPLDIDVPAWLRWLQDIPGSVLVAACEQNYATALGNLKALFSFIHGMSSYVRMATSGALLLFCSRYGPTSYVPCATEIYLNELALRCSDHENIHSILYDIVLACDYHDDGMSSHVYNDLGSYLTWRWVRVSPQNRWLRRDMVDFGIPLGSQLPQFYPASVSMEGPTKNAACVELVRSLPGFDTKTNMDVLWGSLLDDFLEEVGDITFLGRLNNTRATREAALDKHVEPSYSEFIP